MPRCRCGPDCFWTEAGKGIVTTIRQRPSSSRDAIARSVRCRSQLSGGLFRHQRMGRFLRLEFCNLHFLPVIAEFPATIQAHHIRSRADSRGTACVRAHGDRKTVPGVPATKYRVHHLRKHRIHLIPRINGQDFAGFLSLFYLLRFVGEGKGSGWDWRHSLISGGRGGLPKGGLVKYR
jgi:hypothetical protein